MAMSEWPIQWNENNGVAWRNGVMKESEKQWRRKYGVA
jgi:hypothetical protein